VGRGAGGGGGSTVTEHYHITLVCNYKLSYPRAGPRGGPSAARSRAGPLSLSDTHLCAVEGRCANVNPRAIPTFACDGYPTRVGNGSTGPAVAGGWPPGPKLPPQEPQRRLSGMRGVPVGFRAETFNRRMNVVKNRVESAETVSPSKTVNEMENATKRQANW